MKLKLLILSLFIGFIAQAQTPLPGSTLVNARYQWLAGKFNQLKIPMYADTTQYPLWLPRVGGDMMLDTAGADQGVIYVRYNMYWHGVSGNGGSSDTSGYKYFSAQYPLILVGGGDTAYLSIDTAGLSGGGGGSVSLPYRNVDSLRLHTAASFQGASTLGYYAPGDGGAASYYWDPTSTSTDDSLTVIKVTGVTTGRWKQVLVNGVINPKTGGAKGDGATDDYWRIQSALTVAGTLNGSIQFPGGVFYHSRTLTPPQNIVIRGAGNRKTTLQITTDTVGMVISSSNMVADMRFFGGNSFTGSTGLKVQGGNKSFIQRVRAENFHHAGFKFIDAQNGLYEDLMAQYNGDANFYLDGTENCTFFNANGNSDNTQNGTPNTMSIYMTDCNNTHWNGGLMERGDNTSQVVLDGACVDASFENMQINGGSAQCILVKGGSTASFEKIQFSRGTNAWNVSTIGTNSSSTIINCRTVGSNGLGNDKLYNGRNLFNGGIEVPVFATNFSGQTSGSTVGTGTTLTFNSTGQNMTVTTINVNSGVEMGLGSGSGSFRPGQNVLLEFTIKNISDSATVNIYNSRPGGRDLLTSVTEGTHRIYFSAKGYESLRFGVLKPLAGSFVMSGARISLIGSDSGSARITAPIQLGIYTPAADTSASGSQLLSAGQTKDLIEGRKQWRDTTGGIYNNSGSVTVGLLNSSSTAKFRINATTGVIESKGLFLSNAIASTLHQRDTTTAALIGTLKNRLFQHDRRIYLTTDSATVSDITGGNNTFMVYPRGYTYFNTVGGDLSNSVRNEFSFNKQAGFSGLSVLQGGVVNYDVVPVTLNYMTGYNGTNVNNYSLKGWWAGSGSYIHLRQAYDSVEHWAGFYASGHNQFGTNNIKNAYGYYSTAIPGAVNSWGVYSKDAVLKNFMEGSLGIGTGNELPEANLDLSGTFKYVDGNQSNGKVLTSDASGNATWQTASGGGGAAANTNLGSGYRLVVPSTQEIKTILGGAGILIDSTTTPGSLIFSITASGNVNTGAANQLTYYAGAGTTVSPLTAITASRALASNASGLPVAATTTATELGYVNGVTSAIQTQINTKRALTGQTTTASSATPAPVGSVVDNQFFLTALAANATFAAPSGTPANGNTLLIRIKDNGTARTLAWNAIYTAGTGFSLPSTTVIGEDMYIQFVYNSTTATWQLTGVRSSTAIGPWVAATGGINYSTGNVGIATAAPTAKLHLPAGTATANTAPLKLTTGVVKQTTNEQGAVNFDGTRMYFATSSALGNFKLQGTSVLRTSTVSVPMDPASWNVYVFTGGSAASWTLQDPTLWEGDILYVKNTGSVNLTVNSATGSQIFNTSAVANIVLTPGQNYKFISDGTYWQIFN